MEETQNNNQEVIHTSPDAPKTAPVVNKSANNNLPMSWAVVIAGVVVALAIILSSGSNKSSKEYNINTGNKIVSKDISDIRQIEPVSANDRILGDLKDAKVAIIEFSDFQCPYCKQIHPILTQIKDHYGNDVVWVYRHFPLEQIHPQARPAAHASECVLDLGGNDMFWKFVNNIFAKDSAKDTLGDEGLLNIATSIGINKDDFAKCQTSNKHDELINTHLKDAELAGAGGTPDVTIINLETKEAIHTGANPEAITKVIDQILGK